MSTFHIPQRRVAARILLEGGREIEGHLHAPAQGEDTSGDPTGEGELISVHLDLAGGFTVAGEVRIMMPPEDSRLQDFLNAADAFFPVIDQTGTFLVNRRLVDSVRAR